MSRGGVSRGPVSRAAWSALAALCCALLLSGCASTPTERVQRYGFDGFGAAQGSTGGGGGSVTLPGSSTDNAVVRWNGTGGATLQDSGVLVDDSDRILLSSTIAVSPIAAGVLGVLDPTGANVGIVRHYDAGGTGYLEAYNNGTDAFLRTSTSSLFRFQTTGSATASDAVIRVYDAADTAYASLTHNGTNATLSASTGAILAGADFAPASASGSSLGSTVLEWANLYVGTGRAYFGASQEGSVFATGGNALAVDGAAGGVFITNSGNARWQFQAGGALIPFVANAYDLGSTSNEIRSVYLGTGRIYLGTGQEASIHTGTGSPEGAVTANVGSLYLRSDGSTGTTLYVKESGTGNTGWAAK